MAVKICAFILFAMLSACSHQMAECRGTPFALNPGPWQQMQAVARQ